MRKQHRSGCATKDEEWAQRKIQEGGTIYRAPTKEKQAARLWALGREVRVACRAVSGRSRMGCLHLEEGTCHGHRRTDSPRFRVHQRAIHRLFQAGKPLAHGRGAQKGEGGVWT